MILSPIDVMGGGVQYEESERAYGCNFFVDLAFTLVRCNGGYPALQLVDTVVHTAVGLFTSDSLSYRRNGGWSPV